MTKKTSNYFCLIVGLVFNQIVSFAQSGASPYFFSTRHNSYIEYLVNNGKLPINLSLSQPPLSGDLKLKLQDTAVFHSHWDKLLLFDLNQMNKTADSSVEWGSLNLFADINNQISFNTISNNSICNRVDGRVGFIYSFKNFVFVNRMEADQRFLEDTLYFNSEGKFQNKNFGRLKDSYISWQNENVEFLLGRQDRNLGSWNTKSLILSDNAFSFDQLSFSLKNARLKFSSTISRLNDIYGYDVRIDSSDYRWNKRYLSIHRLEVFPNHKLSFAITESVLYGGTSQQPIYNYLNPINFFFLSKVVDRTGYEQQTANAFIATEFFYKPTLKTAFYGQLLVDDLDFTKSLRAIYPDRLGGIIKASITDFFPKTQMIGIYTRVSNWTYNSFYTWGNYVSYGKSLGYPQNGIQRFDLKVTFFNIKKVRYEMALAHERMRKQNLATHFVPIKSSLLMNLDQRNYIAYSSLTYFPTNNFSASIDVNYISNISSENLSSIKTNYFLIGLKLNGYGFFNLF